MGTRKQVYDLTPTDLDNFPIWEFAQDEEGEEDQDEATVRPWEGDGAVNPETGMFIVHAGFRFADGTTAIGYLTPPSPEESDLGVIQPVIVSPAGQVAFWCGVITPTADQLNSFYSLLSSTPERMFPIFFESLAPVQGGPVRGSLPGFMVLEDWRTGATRIVR